MGNLAQALSWAAGRLDIAIGSWFGSVAPTVGQKAAASSIPVVLASDDLTVRAASLRAPLRGELLPITITTTAKVFNVPDGTGGAPQWKGKLVRMQADGADVYIQVSLGLDANVDKAATAQEATASGRITLTPSASGNGAFCIPSGTWLDVPIPAAAQTFAAVGSASCTLRTHPSET